MKHRSPRSALILVVTDLFHPFDSLAIELFLNGEVRHGCRRRGPEPMFLPRREPDYIPRMNVLDRAISALDPPVASRHDQGLAQRVGVPGNPSARLEGDTGTGYTCRIGCLEERVNANCMGKTACLARFRMLSGTQKRARSCLPRTIVLNRYILQRRRVPLRSRN